MCQGHERSFIAVILGGSAAEGPQGPAGRAEAKGASSARREDAASIHEKFS